MEMEGEGAVNLPCEAMGDLRVTARVVVTGIVAPVDWLKTVQGDAVFVSGCRTQWQGAVRAKKMRC